MPEYLLAIDQGTTSTRAIVFDLALAPVASAQQELRQSYPAPGLGAITAAVLAINAADDERNPPELGTTEAAIRKLKNARYYLIPASPQTRGHGTTGNVALWQGPFTAWLATVPKK